MSTSICINFIETKLTSQLGKYEMRLIELFESEPVDLAAFRKHKAGDEFHKKLTNLAADLPNMFGRQAEQEDWFNNELLEITKRMNAPLQKYQMEIRPLIVGHPKATISEILAFSIMPHHRQPEDSNEVLARKFVKTHRDELIELALRAKEELRELTQKAETMHWPAPWQRYTRYSSYSYALGNYINLLKHRLFEDGRIVKNVNTTMDVQVDEIPRQAKKFGFHTTVGGEPPLLKTNGKNLYQQNK